MSRARREDSSPGGMPRNLTEARAAAEAAVRQATESLNNFYNYTSEALSKTSKAIHESSQNLLAPLEQQHVIRDGLQFLSPVSNAVLQSSAMFFDQLHHGAKQLSDSLARAYNRSTELPNQSVVLSDEMSPSDEISNHTQQYKRDVWIMLYNLTVDALSNATDGWNQLMPLPNMHSVDVGESSNKVLPNVDDGESNPLPSHAFMKPMYNVSVANSSQSHNISKRSTYSDSLAAAERLLPHWITASLHHNGSVDKADHDSQLVHINHTEGIFHTQHRRETNATLTYIPPL